MIKFKSIILGLGLQLSLSATVQAGGKGCALNVSNSNLEISSCIQTRGVTIWTLFPRNKPIYAGNLDALPTLIFAGDDLDIISRQMGGNDSLYINLMNLPSHGRVLSATEAPLAIKLSLNKENWRLTSVVDVTYEGVGDNEGPFLICGTYDRKINFGYIFVSQCNSSDEKDRAALKDLLGIIEGQFK